jgi:hypothetical protein
MGIGLGTSNIKGYCHDEINIFMEKGKVGGWGVEEIA